MLVKLVPMRLFLRSQTTLIRWEESKCEPEER
ncbi:hypothetical protein LEMLEM_LOCUS3459 [Lemmus lemmus]